MRFPWTRPPAVTPPPTPEPDPATAAADALPEGWDLLHVDRTRPFNLPGLEPHPRRWVATVHGPGAMFKGEGATVAEAISAAAARIGHG